LDASGPPAAIISPAPGGDRESARWLEDLTGPRREEAIGRLREWLLGISRAEVNRRRAQLGFGGPELDDIAEQAASDATVAVLRKLDQFRGESRVGALRSATFFAAWSLLPLTLGLGLSRAEVRRIEDLRLTALEERIEADLELGRDGPHRFAVEVVPHRLAAPPGSQVPLLLRLHDQRAQLRPLGSRRPFRLNRLAPVGQAPS